MLWNAPIWLNEMLVTVIKFFVGVFPLIFSIAVVGLVYVIIGNIRNKRPLIYAVKEKDILVPFGSLLAACMGLMLFYLPQPVIHENYSFDKISIQMMSPSSKTDRIEISDKKSLDEFREIFRESICRRSTDLGGTAINSETVFIDLTVFDDHRAFPLHFIVTQGNLRRYTAVNTDFIYIVEDEESILSDKVFEYVSRYAEAAKADNIASGISEQITGFAWEVINRDIDNYELNPEVKIIDSRITRLELVETFDALADASIKVYALEYRLLPEDLSKVVMAGGMDVDEDGWLKQTCSMGSPLLVIAHRNGEAELIGVIWTGEMGGKDGMEAEIKNLLEQEINTNLPAENDYTDIAKLGNMFGFTDETGGSIILADPSLEANSLENISKAIGENGNILTIKYIEEQKGTDKDNGRMTSQNFDNVAGHIFEVVQGEAKGNETYYLISEDAFNIKSVIDSEEGSSSEIDIRTKEAIEGIKGRKILNSWEISRLGNDKSIYLLLFERDKDDMLASIVMKTPASIVFKDYPAKYDDASTWRVDDGGAIFPEMFSILFAANTENGVLIGISWMGFEGEVTTFLKENGDSFEELDIGTYRYMLPI